MNNVHNINNIQMIRLLTLSILLTWSINVLNHQNPTVESEADQILGKWTNAEKTAHFEITESNGKYYGKITWGTGRDTKDSKNPDPSLRSRALVGLTILKDFEFEGDGIWSAGTIYDPNDGKTYSCKLTLKTKDKLEVRGYIGISLFGRTDIWTRIK
jgi:uncharacterized protein (DUF2147 family)